MATCRWFRAWVGPCRNEIPEGDFCPDHAGKVCTSCGQAANHDCEQTMGPLVCGSNLCPECSHGDPRTFSHKPKAEAAKEVEAFFKSIE